jgi:hypothetical protein
MLRACVGMMKIAGDKFAIAAEEIACEIVEILRADMEMSGETRAHIEFARQYGIATVAFHGEQLNGCPRNWQLFPSGSAGGQRKQDEI